MNDSLYEDYMRSVLGYQLMNVIQIHITIIIMTIIQVMM